MELQLKQRLVGITVIFSLAVIFLPMLLDGSGRNPQQISISIPPAPQVSSPVRVEEKVIELRKEIEEMPVLSPRIVDEISDPPDPETAPIPEAETAKTETKKSSEAVPKTKPPAIKEKPKAVKQAPKVAAGGESWVIQLGSFKEKNKAYKLRDRIRQSKLSAVFIEKFGKGSSTTYRVRMGPFLTREKAKVVLNKVMAKYNVKGLVMSYEK